MNDVEAISAICNGEKITHQCMPPGTFLYMHSGIGNYMVFDENDWEVGMLESLDWFGSMEEHWQTGWSIITK